MCKKLIYSVLVILVLAFGSLTQAGLPEWEAGISGANPLHWYKFDETGSDCIDSGSAGLNGTYDGVSLAQEGFFGAGTAVGFERSGANRANFENATDMPGPWTVEYIVKTTKPPAATDSQALHDSDATSIRLAGWTDLGEAGFTLYGVADYRFTPEGDLTLNDLVIQQDVWMHLVWRNDGNGTQLFFNGQLVGTSPDSIDLPRLRIGARGAGPAIHKDKVEFAKNDQRWTQKVGETPSQQWHQLRLSSVYRTTTNNCLSFKKQGFTIPNSLTRHR